MEISIFNLLLVIVAIGAIYVLYIYRGSVKKTEGDLRAFYEDAKNIEKDKQDPKQ